MVNKVSKIEEKQMAEITKEKTQIKQVDREIPYQSISSDDLERMLFAVNGATFAQLHTVTIPTMRSTNNPFVNDVTKNSCINVVIDFDYESNVNSARIKEAIVEAKKTGIDNAILSQLLGQLSTKELATIATATTEKFEVQPRRWGAHMVDVITNKVSRIMVDHTNKQGQYHKYVQVRVLNTETPIYVHNNGQQYTDAELTELKKFFPEPRKSKTQDLDREIILRDYDIDNIRKIHINKRRFIIR